MWNKWKKMRYGGHCWALGGCCECDQGQGPCRAADAPSCSVWKALSCHWDGAIEEGIECKALIYRSVVVELIICINTGAEHSQEGHWCEGAGTQCSEHHWESQGSTV